jgi:hypothetical protein
MQPPVEQQSKNRAKPEQQGYTFHFTPPEIKEPITRKSFTAVHFRLSTIFFCRKSLALVTEHSRYGSSCGVGSYINDWGDTGWKYLFGEA